VTRAPELYTHVIMRLDVNGHICLSVIYGDISGLIDGEAQLAAVSAACSSGSPSTVSVTSMLPRVATE
jgi:hypothetical protein